MLRRMDQKRLRGLRLAARNNRDAHCISRLVTEGNPQTKREQQGKHENPEDNFRFALEFEHARHEQMAVARPTSVSSRWTELRRICSYWCFLRDVHRFRLGDGLPNPRLPL